MTCYTNYMLCYAELNNWPISIHMYIVLKFRLGNEAWGNKTKEIILRLRNEYLYIPFVLFPKPWSHASTCPWSHASTCMNFNISKLIYYSNNQRLGSVKGWNACDQIVFCAFHSHCWLNTCNTCEITTWRLGLQAPHVAHN